MLLGLLQSILDGLGAILDGTVNLLPKSPFASLNAVALDSDILGFIAWLVPFPQILALLQTWIACISVYYLYMIILRWTKAIG